MLFDFNGQLVIGLFILEDERVAFLVYCDCFPFKHLFSYIMLLYPFVWHFFQAMTQLVAKSCEDARQKVCCGFGFP